MSDKIVIICYNPITEKASRQVTRHGSSTYDINVIAVAFGNLCKKGSCRWCDELRDKCSGRRRA